MNKFFNVCLYGGWNKVAGQPMLACTDVGVTDINSAVAIAKRRSVADGKKYVVTNEEWKIKKEICL